MKVKMNKEQQERFNKNIPLARFYFKKLYTEGMKKVINEPEEFYQLCLIGLWKATLKFNGNERGWSTLVLNYIRTEIKNEISILFAKKRVPIDKSFSLELENNEGKRIFEIPYNQDFDKKLQAEEIRNKIKTLSDKQREAIYRRYWLNETFSQMSQATNKSKEACRLLISYGEKVLKTKLKDCV